MAYEVVIDFKDLRDGGYEYKKGDKYPHAGAADPERASYLMMPTAQRSALIKEVAEETKQATRKKQEK